MQVKVDHIKELRELTGAGLMDCKKALEEAGGDFDSAKEALKQRGFAMAAKKADRTMANGLVEAYLHAGGRIGAMVELNCETDFVARMEDFKNLAHDIAMQVAAADPKYLTLEEASPEETPEEVSLLCQPFIKDPQKTVQDIVVELVGKVGENIGVAKFSRFEIGA